MPATVVRELITLLGYDVDSRDLKVYEKQMADVRRGFSKFADRAKLVVTALGAVGGALAARELFKTNVEFERLQAQLETIEGSSLKAETAFAWIEDFATTTPFNLNNVVESFIKLRAVGLDVTREDMNSIGNTAAAFGRDIVEFSESVVAATTGEMERLKQFGIVARQQGEQVTFTFKGQKTTIKKDAESISGFLLKLGETEFAGGMERQMNTIGGKLSNLQDQISKFFRRVGGGTDANEAFKELLEVLTGTVGQGDELADTVGNALAVAFRAAAAGVEFLVRNLDKFKTIAIFLIALKLVKWFQILGVIINGLIIKYRLLGASALFAQIQMLLIPLAIAAIITAIVLLAQDLIVFFKGGDSAIGMLIEKIMTMPGAVGAVLRFIVAFFQSAFLVISTIIKAAVLGWLTLFDTFREVGIAVLRILKPHVQTLVDFFKFQGAILRTIFGWYFKPLIFAWKFAFGLVWGGLKKLKDGFMAVGNFFGGIFGKDTTRTLNTELSGRAGVNRDAAASAATAGRGGGGRTQNVQGGKVEVNVNSSNASPDAIQSAVAAGERQGLNDAARDLTIATEGGPA